MHLDWPKQKMFALLQFFVLPFLADLRNTVGLTSLSSHLKSPDHSRGLAKVQLIGVSETC